ncbi:MAG: polysaccharide biosynthesis C-terminal domain-containing protein, partial [Bacilli bacterium]|nr:polysaccharide biosynthesis C-terminal domain-containing protein [Bacilli bacterium]
GIPIFIKYGLEYAVAFVVLTNIISELTSIFVLFFFLPKNFKLTKKDLQPNITNIKEIFSIGIPTTMSRLIGTIGYFFEPIILTYALLKTGYSNNFIINEYGIINGFIMPLILLPSFFTLAISQALIPNISKAYVYHNFNYVKGKIKLAIILSLLIGIPATIIFETIPTVPMKLIYNTTEGIEYIKILAPICLFHYIQAPLTASLQAMGKAKEAMNGTLIGTIARIISLYFLCSLYLGMWGLIWSSAINMILVTTHQYLHVKKALKK